MVNTYAAMCLVHGQDIIFCDKTKCGFPSSRTDTYAHQRCIHDVTPPSNCRYGHYAVTAIQVLLDAGANPLNIFHYPQGKCPLEAMFTRARNLDILLAVSNATPGFADIVTASGDPVLIAVVKMILENSRS